MAIIPHSVRFVNTGKEKKSKNICRSDRQFYRNASPFAVTLFMANRQTAPTGNTAPTGTSVAQSSDANIMAALEGDGQVHGFDLIITDATGGIRNTAGDTATPQTGGQRIPLAGGRYVRLRLNTATPADQDSPGAIVEILDDAAITAGEDYIFWGHWEYIIHQLRCAHH